MAHQRICGVTNSEVERGAYLEHELLTFLQGNINMIISRKCWPSSEEKRLVHRQKEHVEGRVEKSIKEVLSKKC